MYLAQPKGLTMQLAPSRNAEQIQSNQRIYIRLRNSNDPQATKSGTIPKPNPISHPSFSNLNDKRTSPEKAIKP